MIRYIPLIFKSSMRNRRRSVLTILSIGVSLCLLGVLMAVYYAFYFSNPTPDQALRIVVRNKVSLTNPLPLYYRNQIQQIPGVVHIANLGWYGGTYKDSRDSKNFFARFITKPEDILSVRPELVLTEDEKKAFIRDRAGCIIGRPLADTLGIKLGDRIPLIGDIYPGNIELTVRGVYDASNNNEVLYFNEDYVWEGLPERRKGQVGQFTILADNADSVPRIIRTVDEMFANSTVQTKTETEQAFQLAFASSLGNIKMFLIAIGAAVTFTILLVSANTMAMSVRERVREVGILKTLGFTQSAILGMILGEAAVISVIGGTVGLILASLLCAAVRRGPAIIGQLKTMSMTPPVIATTLAAAIVIGVVSAFSPAYGAARTPIIDALRSTD
jgi:putative ABC transport system permease protein